MQALPTRLATGNIPEVPVEWVATGGDSSGYPSRFAGAQGTVSTPFIRPRQAKAAFIKWGIKTAALRKEKLS